MREISKEYIQNAIKPSMKKESSHPKDSMVNNVCIDSRHAKENTLFFAIKGEKTDGHLYINDVINAGCRNIVIDNESSLPDNIIDNVNIYLTDDATNSLVLLATKYMDDWKDLIRVAITGSVGKTSTKEFTYSVLSSKYKTGKTQGNLNSEYGIPLTCFNLDTDIEFAVIEIGLGYGYDMLDLVNIVKPDAAIITTIGSSHLEVFKTQENLFRNKLNICSRFTPDNLLVVNSNCEYLNKAKIKKTIDREFEILTVGDNDSDFMINNISISANSLPQAELMYKDKKYEFTTPLIGAHNLYNAALAIAIGEHFGISIEDAIKSLNSTYSNPNRLERIKTDMYYIINDSYNASPESMMAGIDILEASQGRKVAILGNMFELGDNEINLHKTVGEYALSKDIDVIITIGNLAKYIVDFDVSGARIKTYSFDNVDDALSHLPKILNKGDSILLKASNSMNFSRIAEEIKYYG